MFRSFSLIVAMIRTFYSIGCHLIGCCDSRALVDRDLRCGLFFRCVEGGSLSLEQAASAGGSSTSSMPPAAADASPCAESAPMHPRLHRQKLQSKPNSRGKTYRSLKNKTANIEVLQPLTCAFSWFSSFSSLSFLYEESAVCVTRFTTWGRNRLLRLRRPGFALLAGVMLTRVRCNNCV